MTTESNFYILSHMRPPRAKRSKRIAYLENTLAQLAQYHKVAPRLKQPVIFRLIVRYETLINKIKEL
jgi:hypothetical protein